MIMRQGHQLLLPANPFFIFGSVLTALSLNMLQNMGLWGRAAWMPDILALVLVFWSVHQPRHVGIGVAFVFGLFLDVHQGAMLGQHGLAYTVLSYLAIAIHRRISSGTDVVVAATMNNLAVLLGTRGDFAEAEELHRDALAAAGAG